MQAGVFRGIDMPHVAPTPDTFPGSHSDTLPPFGSSALPEDAPPSALSGGGGAGSMQ